MEFLKSISTMWWLLIVGVILIIILISKYNKLVKLKLNRENAFADIDVQLKLRFDLVWNLVNTVKGYAKHEKDTLENITKARTSFLNAGSADTKMQANNMLSWALKSLFAVAENYPDLKANSNFLELQRELSDIENKLWASRRYFNSATKEYNTSIQVFPDSIIASMFWFRAEKFFEIENEAEKETPNVNF